MAVRSKDDSYQSPNPGTEGTAPINPWEMWKRPALPSTDDVFPKYPWWMAPLPVFPSQPSVLPQPSEPSSSHGPTSYPSWMIPFVPPPPRSQPPGAPQAFVPTPSQGPGSSADPATGVASAPSAGGLLARLYEAMRQSSLQPSGNVDPSSRDGSQQASLSQPAFQQAVRRLVGRRVQGKSQAGCACDQCRD